MHGNVPLYFPMLLERECRRLGVDLEDLGALAGDGALTSADFLAWLRTLPGGLGHEAFLARLHRGPDEGGPHAPPPGTPEAPDAATYQDPELDAELAFMQECDRIVWPVLRAHAESEASAVGFNLPYGQAAALANLRRLPDAATREDVLAALNSPAPEPGV